MPTPAQAAAATAGAGSLAAAGAYGITSAVKSNEETTEETTPTQEATPQLTPKTIKEAKNESYAANTLAHKEDNKTKLIDIKDPENQEWWKDTYNTRFLEENKKQDKQIHSLFEGINGGYEAFEEASQTAKTSLNYACHKAYGLLWYDFIPENHLLANVKLFCTKNEPTIELSEPQENPEITPIFLNGLESICTDEQRYKNKFGCKNSNKEKLVASTGKAYNKNENWWKWTYKKNFLEKKKEANEPLDDAFKSVTSAYSTNAVASPGPQTSLNQACEEIYKKSDNITVEKLQGNIKLFCTKEGSSVSLNFD